MAPDTNFSLSNPSYSSTEEQPRKRKIKELSGSEANEQTRNGESSSRYGEYHFIEQGPHRGQLCDRCKNIDLDSALKAPRSINGKAIMPLGEVTAEMKLSSCPLCRLFASISTPLKPWSKFDSSTNRGHHLRAFSGFGINPFNARKIGLSVEPGVALGVGQGLSGKHFDNLQRRRCFARGLIAPVLTQSSQSQAFQARLVNSRDVNFVQLKAWLHHCQGFHGNVCEILKPTGSLPFVVESIQFECIDCLTRKIVPIQLTDSYYALSHVWGCSESNISIEEIVRQTRSLPSYGVPQVIEDGMTVVQRLGGQYLWVDKFCIDQNDADQKHTQIQNMDKIYEGACATIVAAGNDGDRSCLPGVGSFPRVHQPTFCFGAQLLVSTLPHLSHILSESNWMTRGWTYQEAVLSRRCFYFTDHQVYFVCRGMTCCESVDMVQDTTGISLNDANDLRTDVFDTLLMTRGKAKKGLWQYFEHLYHYKGRQLKYDSDSINAFQGILTRSWFYNLWGVPVIGASELDGRLVDKDYNVRFARAIMWENPVNPYVDNSARSEKLTPFRRRSDFPTWSWAGWAGSIRPCLAMDVSDYGSESKCHEVDIGKFDTRFWAELKCGGRVTLAELVSLAIKMDEMPDLSPILHIETTTYRIRIRQLDNSIILCCCKPGESHVCHLHIKYQVRIFEDLAANPGLHHRILNETWDALELFYSPSTRSYALFIIDWSEDVARVVGVTFMHKVSRQDLLSRKRAVKLG